MKILLSSYPFAPSVGGVEEVSDILAHELSARGHEVRVATMTPSTAPDTYPFEVVRRPNAATLFDCVRWCDVYLQQGISLRLAWPLLLARRPWVVALQGPVSGSQGLGRLKGWLKRRSLGFAHVIACSAAVARGLPKDAVVIPNPFRDAAFRCLSDRPRPYDLVFLGRLVSDKGATLLPEVLTMLRDRGLALRLLIIGGGPEEANLRARCRALNLVEQVEFAGVLRGTALVQRLNQCKIMVVPSLWEEPFGIVAIEGIAAGCVVIASHAGGLPEAVGPCGVTFPKGDVAALAGRIEDLLRDDAKRAALLSRAPEHLSHHRSRAVADAYVEVIRKALAVRWGQQ